MREDPLFPECFFAFGRQKPIHEAYISQGFGRDFCPGGVELLARHRGRLDLSRFDAAPLIAFTATKEMNYGTETDG
jgi:hypothetical protein